MQTGESRADGFTLLGLLFLIAGLGVAMAALGVFWSAAAQREKEAELLFIGEEYRRALESYYQAAPDGLKRHPGRLEDLLADPRFPHLVRHLRRVYRDPMSGEPTWGLERDALGDIIGVYSPAPGVPRKSAGFPEHLAHFNGAAGYADWVFRARLEAPGQGEKGAATARPGQRAPQ